MLNTVSFSLSAATICTVLGFATAYLVIRRLLPFASLPAFFAVAPVAIPGVVLAIFFYASYAGLPLSRYGSCPLVFLAFVNRFLTIAFVACPLFLSPLNPVLVYG